MNIDAFVKEWIFPFFLTGGLGYLIVQRILDRKRNAADTRKIKTETESITVENAMKMESHIYERYVKEAERYEETKRKLDEEEKRYEETKNKLDEVQSFLNDVREELARQEKKLQAQKEYIVVLEEFIVANGLEVPSKPQPQIETESN